MENSVSRVECLRQMMHITAFNKGISHPDVLVISRKLDEAINSLYKVDLIEKDCINEPVVAITEPTKEGLVELPSYSEHNSC